MSPPLLPQDITMTSEISEEEFNRRFADELVRIVGPTYQEEADTLGEYEDADTRAYAIETAPSYFAEPWQRAEGPEECARTDFSYWED